jgi:CelD/BcsL family acetyltransferase involved in cellulose biosynthesis
VKSRVITSLREFDALAPLWRDMVEESGQRSPFLSHDWFATCWRGAGPNRQREVTILEDSAGPIATFPMVRWRTTRHGVPVRLLGFLDTPDAPFNDVLVVRGVEEALEHFAGALRARRDWDVLTLAKLRADSVTLKAVEAAVGPHMPVRTIEAETLPYLAVRGRFEDYLADRGATFVAEQARLRAQLEAAGRVTIEEHRGLDPDGPLFGELMDLSRHRWKVPKRVAVLTARGMPRFFRDLTQRLVARDWLSVWMLRLDGRLVAAEYDVVAGDSVYAVRSDADESVARLEPWCVLTGAIVRALFERGTVRHYHMGHPGMTHKFDWATAANDTLTLEAYAPTRYGRFLHGLEVHVMPVARRLRRSVRRGRA